MNTSPEVHAAHLALGREVMRLDQVESRVWAATGYPPLPPDDDVRLPARWAEAATVVQLALAWVLMEARP